MWNFGKDEILVSPDNSTEVNKTSNTNHAVGHTANSMWCVSTAAGGQTAMYTDTRQQPEVGAGFVQCCCYTADLQGTGAVAGAF